MVSKEEISRRLEMKRKGLDPDKEVHNANKPQYIKKEIKTRPENKIICTKCQTMNLETSKYCINCGNELKKEQKVKIDSNSVICPECGTENKEAAKFCIGCGKNLKELSIEVVEEAPEDETIVDIKETPLEADAEEIEYELEVSDEKTDLLDKIKKAKELLDMGAITEEEFEKIKNRYLEEFNQ